MSILQLLLGRPLASSEQHKNKIGVVTGVPVLGLDALSSAAYGPEAALEVLIPLGALGLVYIGPISLVILALLLVLYLSYRQTIAAYPNGGGSYTVAKENLGTWTGLLAAAALMLDYILNVAVGISAGIAALTSAVPALHHYTLELCLAVLVLITLVNLRGTPEAGLTFAAPTYLFVGSLCGVLAWGVWKTIQSGGAPAPVAPPPPIPPAMQALSIWLLLRCFASGCTAMTGVEAVSNGITAFRDPAMNHARRTLTVIVVLLAIMLAGIAYLVRVYHIGAMEQEQPGYQSVLSQLTAAVAGRGAFYYITIASLLLVLSLSANTSFADFPRLCRLIARDDYLPRPFTVVGRRLVFTVGILFLAGASGVLLIVFGGITNKLIPLFAIGAFMAFTLSQAGMVQHWRRQLREGDSLQGRWARTHARVALALNGVGTTATAIALGIIIVAKFVEGAWITLLVIPCLLLLFHGVKRQYERLARDTATHEPLDLSNVQPPVVVLPAENWNKPVREALRFGMRLSPDVTAIHLCALDPERSKEDEERIRRQWRHEVTEPARRAGVHPPHLELIHSPYREFIEPLLQYIERLRGEHPDRIIAVIVPELVKQHWWQFLLHTNRAALLRSALLRSRCRGLVVVVLPWQMDQHDGRR